MSTTRSSIVRDRLVHIADLHFWAVVWNPFALASKRFLGNLNVMLRRGRHFRMERAEPFADYVASLGIPALLMTGDFTSTSTDAEFRRAREFVDGLVKRGFDVSLMPGNHDVYTFREAREGRFEKYFKPYLPENGFPALRKLSGGTSLIMVPTVCANRISSAGRISAEEAAATEALLREASDPVIVGAHYPALHETDAYASGINRRLRNAEALRRVVGECGKRVLYAAGHVHRFSYTRDPQFSNVTHLSSGAFFYHQPRQNCFGEFSEIDISDAGFRVHRHVYRDDAWERQRVEEQ
ncbi:MAG TPA: metallophosphoesterase [Candidatus Hydrogenedentes bacterium]|jgi:3',5'-cyclic AMP phosphodiesterase CpdA|nr:metallophosphoesterase [Candidatus Hydrogenedentota bacterium]HPJ99524.1 metallophosphoesterase [Candidatus Hydrogenedentota bacterium]